MGLRTDIHDVMIEVLSELTDLDLSFKTEIGGDAIAKTESFHVILMAGFKYIGEFLLSEFPGSPQFLISHGVYIRDEYRGKGLGQALHRARLTIAKRGHYTALFAVVSSDNKMQAHILDKHGWQCATGYRVTDDRRQELWVNRLLG